LKRAVVGFDVAHSVEYSPPRCRREWAAAWCGCRSPWVDSRCGPVRGVDGFSSSPATGRYCFIEGCSTSCKPAVSSPRGADAGS
jgi:hypothetical protein